MMSDIFWVIKNACGINMVICNISWCHKIVYQIITVKSLLSIEIQKFIGLLNQLS